MRTTTKVAKSRNRPVLRKGWGPSEACRGTGKTADLGDAGGERGDVAQVAAMPSADDDGVERHGDGVRARYSAASRSAAPLRFGNRGNILCCSMAALNAVWKANPAFSLMSELS